MNILNFIVYIMLQVKSWVKNKDLVLSTGREALLDC